MSPAPWTPGLSVARLLSGGPSPSSGRCSSPPCDEDRDPTSCRRQLAGVLPAFPAPSSSRPPACPAGRPRPYSGMGGRATALTLFHCLLGPAIVVGGLSWFAGRARATPPPFPAGLALARNHRPDPAVRHRQPGVSGHWLRGGSPRTRPQSAGPDGLPPPARADTRGEGAEGWSMGASPFLARHAGRGVRAEPATVRTRRGPAGDKGLVRQAPPSRTTTG